MHFAIGIAAVLGSGLVRAARISGDAASRSNNIIPGHFLVEFADDHDHDSFYNSLHGNGILVSPRMNLSHSVFRGASFRINGKGREMMHASKISAMPAVKGLWSLRNYSVPQLQHGNTMANPHGTIIPENEILGIKDAWSTHSMTQVDRLHAKGHTGTGIRIGIVDTGVDYTHPALGGCFGKDCLIEYGYDVVGNEWNGMDAPNPDGDPFDNCIGHGTHVSGIIAAQPNKMNFTGVAPGAKLGMYKVFSCYSGGTTDDVLIKAFSLAYEDGSDIITASIGGFGGWSEVPWSVVVSRIVDLGVPCTLAAGNEGANGLFTSSTAADGKGVTAVASFDNIVTPRLASRGHYTVGSQSRNDMSLSTPSTPLEKQHMSFAWIPGWPYPFENISLPLTALSNYNTTADACSPLPDNTLDLSNSVVLVSLGGCDVGKKARNVMARNGDYILFYSETLVEVDVDDREHAFPGSSGTGWVSASQGAQWLKMLNDGQHVQLTFVAPAAADTIFMQVPNNITGGFASYYTSWGPTYDLDVYPTIAAPGGNIFSTYPLRLGGYATDSGTSMATPFIAGVYALLLEVRGTLTKPADLDRLVATTAKANRWNDGAGALHELAPTAQQGAGLVQAYDAAFATTLMSVKSIAFNDSDHSGPVEFTIENTGEDTITYRIGHNPAIGMYVLNNVIIDEAPSYFPNTIYTATADMSFSRDLVNLQPGHRATITVTPIPPNDDTGFLYEGLLPIYSGYIAVNGSDGSNLSVPYLGVAGSLYEVDNLDTIHSTSLLCLVDGDEEEWSCGYNETFTVPYPASGVDPTSMEFYHEPSADVSLILGTSLLRADVIPYSSTYNGSIHTVLGWETAGSIYGYPLLDIPRGGAIPVWNGMLSDGSVVPEGKYGLLIRALKLFGDPEKKEDYTSLVPIPFNLRYTNSSGIPPFPERPWVRDGGRGTERD